MGCQATATAATSAHLYTHRESGPGSILAHALAVGARDLQRQHIPVSVCSTLPSLRVHCILPHLQAQAHIRHCRDQKDSSHSKCREDGVPERLRLRWLGSEPFDCHTCSGKASNP